MEKKENETTNMLDPYTWLSVKETAQLLGMSERNIQIYCEAGKCITNTIAGKGRGGKQHLIALESLAQSVQEDFFTNQEMQNHEFINSLTQPEREKLYFKYHVVMEYQSYKAIRCSGGRLNQFLSDFNTSHPDSPITKKQVNSWENKYFKEGLKGLYDSRGTHKRGQSSIPDEAWETFYSQWYNSRLSITQCYEMTCEKHKDIENMPEISSFRRKLASIPEPVRILRDGGKKKFEDSCLPYIEVDYDSLSSNEQWVADHHVFDVLVEDEKGRIFRPWLSAWLDRRSRYITGYEVNACAPNSDIVLSSFAKACIKCGIPDGVLLDNGKDFKVYDLFNNQNAMSIARQMGIKVTNAIVKNAKAKPIERYFRTVEEKYLAALPCYIAGKPHLRPEKMNMTNKKLKLKGLCMKYDEFLQIADMVINEMNNTTHSGKGMNGKTPYEIYTSHFSKPAKMVKNEDVLNLLLQRTSRPVKVGRNGIKVSAIGLNYYSEKLFEWFGKEVFARYNSNDVSKVYIYSTDDRFICTAQSNELAQLGTDASMELIREYNRLRKEYNQKTNDLLPRKPFYTLIEFLESRKERHQEFDIRKLNPVIQVVPMKHKHLEAIQKEKEEQEMAGENVTVAYSEKKKKRDVDKAYYEFIRKAGGDF